MGLLGLQQVQTGVAGPEKVPVLHQWERGGHMVKTQQQLTSVEVDLAQAIPRNHGGASFVAVKLAVCRKESRDHHQGLVEVGGGSEAGMGGVSGRRGWSHLCTAGLGGRGPSAASCRTGRWWVWCRCALRRCGAPSHGPGPSSPSRWAGHSAASCASPRRPTGAAAASNPGRHQGRV